MRAGRRTPWAPTGGLLETAGFVSVLALLPALLHARAVADVLVSAIGILFLARSIGLGEWAWTTRPWVRIAGLFWLWLVLCSVRAGNGAAIVQAVVVLRWFVFVAALQTWLLAAPERRRALGFGFLAAAAWIGGECWHQLIGGRDLFGYPRFGDGALTGPFREPRAGSTLVAVLFPAIIPIVWRLLEQARLVQRGAGALLLGVSAVTVVLIGQRMPTLLMLLGLVLSALLMRRLRPAAIGALAAGAVMLVLTPVLAPSTYHKLVLHFAEQMSHFWATTYGQLYLRAGAMVAASPWFGLGFDGFRNNCGDARYFWSATSFGVPASAISLADGCNIHPHNYWLEVATSAGLPGMVLFGILVTVWLRRLSSGVLPVVDAQRVGLLIAAILAFWPLASTSSFFVSDVCGWIMLTIGWGLAAADASSGVATLRAISGRLKSL